MKLITLNTWGGRLNKPILDFIKNHNDTDIFCFQEVNNGAFDEIVDLEEDKNLFTHMQEILPGHIGYFSPQVDGTGHAMFIKNDIDTGPVAFYSILREEEIVNMPDPFPRIMQAVTLRSLGVSIYNFHGVPKDAKQDNPVRDLQTERVMEIIKNDEHPKIIVGDFNLNPDTRAIGEFDKLFTNHIKNSDYKTTRSKHYEKINEFPFADYIFTTPSIKVSEFKVLDDEVSDHLPLLLNFDIEK